ncbi:MAG: S8 family serine peptidase, partial [Christensenella sp.]|uniref:S8 family serine peptidase n=1 Tax=Christensenella sp. TaxID=1935934 RepID=UPI002B21EE67
MNHRYIKKIAMYMMVFFFVCMAPVNVFALGGEESASVPPIIISEESVPVSEQEIQATESPAIENIESLNTEGAEAAKTEEADENLPYVAGEVLVVMDSNAAMPALQQVSDEEPVGVGNDVLKVELAQDMTVIQAIEELQDQPGIQIVQPNFIYTEIESVDTLATTVNDPGIKSQWYLNKIGVPDAWDISKSNKKIRVGVIDSGIDIQHEDLKANLNTSLCYDVRLNKPLTNDLTGHGTHVAGIIAAQANNGKGVAGVSYNAEIIAYNVFYIDTLGRVVANSEDILKAYTRAVNDGAKVINMSFGGYFKSTNDQLLENKINEAAEKGIVTVCAGGNGINLVPQTNPMYPSDFEACISVVPLDNYESTPYWADYNEFKDVAAPGLSIYSTIPTHQGMYDYKSGSSMAAPVVSGVVAMMLAKNPTLGVEQIKDILYSTATDLGDEGKDAHYGWGQVNASAAMQALPVPPIVYIDSIVIKPPVDVALIYPGVSFQMEAEILPRNAADHTLEWSVTNEDGEATITDAGVLVAKKAGRVIVHAKSKDGGGANISYPLMIEEQLLACDGVDIRKFDEKGRQFHAGALHIRGKNGIAEVSFAVWNETTGDVKWYRGNSYGGGDYG